MRTKTLIAAAIAGALSLPIGSYANDQSADGEIVEQDSVAFNDSASSGSSTWIDSSQLPHNEPVSE
jgi:hypothetical protein